MAILVTNDDGIYSSGISALAEAASLFDDVVIVAPDREQSAIGHAITLTVPLRITEIKRDGKLFGYAVNGTPADCVKLAVREIISHPPRLVLSGINFGANTGAAIIYSGTVSAATEGTLLSVPSIAFSIDSVKGDNLGTAKKVALAVVRYVLENGIPDDVLINVNIPDLPLEEIKGVKYIKQGKSYFNDWFQRRKDPKGRTYYWMDGEMICSDSASYGDYTALKEGYVAITPLHLDMTDYKFLSSMRDWNIDIGGNR
ncbi:MAG: 5'/3'-nucleotidase SurE [candidate division Zixibacteria bacterium 4484_93]|nr:MAG: 5'/3'-nucleotidase SurE [candidate division Zixibacteria bacterium 4484_93]